LQTSSRLLFLSSHKQTLLSVSYRFSLPLPSSGLFALLDID
jgi:hypothetical protein